MYNFMLGFLGSLCPAVLFNIERKNLVWSGLSGACGWMVFILAKQKTGSMVISTFFGAIIVSLYSEIMARVLKTPASVFSIVGIFPLLPGVWVYNTLLQLVLGDYKKAFNTGLSTLGMTCSIAFGLMLVSAAFQSYTNIKNYLQSNKLNKIK